METVRRIAGIMLLIGLVGGGCGNEGDNDQGVSLRAVGFFTGDISEQKCTAPTTDKAIADLGLAWPLSEDELDFGYPGISDAFFICHGYIWLQNDLHNQAVNVDRIDFTYEVPGARISIPSHSAPMGIRINPQEQDPSDGATEPQNPFGQVNVFIGQLTGQMIPSHLIAFLRQNQPSLPELPYVMIVHVRARGRSDNGDVLVSNEIRYTFEFLPPF